MGVPSGQRNMVAHWPQSATNPPNFLPKVNVQLSKTSVEFSFEELEKCSFEPRAWRNAFRRGPESQPATRASEIHG